MRAPHAFIPMSIAAALMAVACDGGSSDEPTPSASVTASESSEPTTSPSPSPEPFDFVEGADVAILAALESPTTGEVWHDPVPIENLGLFEYADFGIADTYLYYEVGSRGSATIVVAVANFFEFYLPGQAIQAMFEIDDSGARLITCPSSRAADPCIDWSTDWEAPGRVLDTTTHYDSLTYPLTVQPSAGWYLHPSALGTSGWPTTIQAFGDAATFPGRGATLDNLAFLGRDERTVIAELGDSTLVAYTTEGAVHGTTAVRYAVETPFGSVIPSASQYSAGTYGQGVVTWNDSVDSFTHPDLATGSPMSYPVRSASLTCFGPDEVTIDDFNADEWVEAGTHALGYDVYLPVAGGNDIALDTFTTMRDASWGGLYDGISLDYPYGSYQVFLNARSFFAWQRPDGAWVLGLDNYASDKVYECS